MTFGDGMIFSYQKPAPPPDEPEELIFVRCCICGDEAHVWYDIADYPDIPAGWRALSADCCPTEEIYTCSAKCTMRCGFILSRQHEGEISVREVGEDLAYGEDDDEEPFRPVFEKAGYGG